MGPFYITVVLNRQNFTVLVQLLKKDAAFEWYKISAKNKEIILRNNRPMLLAKGLKKRRPNWVLVQGSVTYQTFIEKAGVLILQHTSNTV